MEAIQLTQIENWCKDNGYVLVKYAGEGIPLSDIEGIASRICKIDKSEIYSKKRKANHVFARWLVWDYIRKTNYYCSFSDIGSMCGMKDHSTVLHGIKELNSARFLDWRDRALIRFKSIMNELHEEMNIRKPYR